MNETQALLTEFVTSRSEAAFRELVACYLDLVYSTALRLVGGDAHRAQDVAQAVFLHLAQKAHTLRPDSTLGGWLHRVTCRGAATVMRGERRRQLREQHAAAMNSLPDHSEANLAQLAPVLDEAINALGAADRTAILLRFYEQRDLRAVGEALGSSENAAQKRIARALEELRSLLRHRGVALSAAALGSMLAADAVTAAPAGLAAAISTSAIGGAAGTSAVTILKTMATLKFKSTALTAVIVAASILTPLLVQHQAQARLHDQDENLRQQSNQLAQLTADNQRLAAQLSQKNSRPVADPQLAELLKLRGEVGRLQRAVSQLKAADPAPPMSPEEKLAYLKSKYATQVVRLKEWLAAHPEEKIPEIDRVSEKYWTDAVGHLAEDDDFARAMITFRANAVLSFANPIEYALRNYGSNNAGQFPADLAQLRPYFKEPVDDAILQHYEIVPASSLVPELRTGGSDAVITQISSPNPTKDFRISYGLNQGGYVTSRHADPGITNRWNPVR